MHNHPSGDLEPSHIAFKPNAELPLRLDRLEVGSLSWMEGCPTNAGHVRSNLAGSNPRVDIPVLQVLEVGFAMLIC